MGELLMARVIEYIVDNPKAVVVTVHGLGEHFGRYQHVGEWLNSQQINMIGGDLPGFGTSTLLRGHIDSFNDYLNQVDQWLSYAKIKWTEVPLILYGHSLGGLIVIRYLQKRNVASVLAGVAVTSPSLSVKLELSSGLLFVAGVLQKIAPKIKFSSGIKPEAVSRHPQIRATYGTDPLNYGKVSAGLFSEMQLAMKEAWEDVAEIDRIGIPMLFLQAGDDQLVDPDKADEFVKLIINERFTYINIPSLYHEVFNEPERDIYLKLFSDWILDTIQ